MNPVGFMTVFERVEAYSPPIESMQTPTEVESGETVSDTLKSMVHVLKKEGVRPETCVFYINPDLYVRLFKERIDARTGSSKSDEIDGDTYLGRPIRQTYTLEEEAILYMSPDSVTLGGQVINPLSVAYARHTDE